MSSSPATELLRRLTADNVTALRLLRVDLDGCVNERLVPADLAERLLVEGFEVKGDGLDSSAGLQRPGGVPSRHQPARVWARPDPGSYRRAPGAEGVGLLLCEHFADGDRPHPLCPRHALRRVSEQAKDQGYATRFAVEYELLLTRPLAAGPAQSRGRWPWPWPPPLEPLDGDWLCLSLGRLVRASEVVDRLLGAWEEAGIEAVSVHHEHGPGVLEAALAPRSVLRAADDAVLARHLGQQSLAPLGVLPIFMARFGDEHQGFGAHVHQSLWDPAGERNLFWDPAGFSSLLASYMAGQLRCLAELTALHAPDINSYKRLLPELALYERACWGVDDRLAPLRVFVGAEHSCRLEFRLPGADLNPYLSLAAQLAAGLWGIRRGLRAPAPNQPGAGSATCQLYAALPRSLGQAAAGLRSKRRLAGELLGAELVDAYVRRCERQVEQYARTVTGWERQRYLNRVAAAGLPPASQAVGPEAAAKERQP